jgi:hypothetical protein
VPFLIRTADGKGKRLFRFLFRRWNFQ